METTNTDGDFIAPNLSTEHPLRSVLVLAILFATLAAMGIGIHQLQDKQAEQQESTDADGSDPPLKNLLKPTLNLSNWLNVHDPDRICYDMRDGGAIKITLGDAKSKGDTSVMYGQHGLYLITGAHYVISFRARGDAARSFEVFGIYDERFDKSVMKSQMLHLDPQWRDYRVLFTDRVPAAHDIAVPIFHLFGGSGHVWLEDIHLQRKS